MNSMLEQIHSLPALIREVFQPFDDAARQTLMPELCLSVKRIFVTGCGDSHHAALGSELAFEALSGVPTEPQTSLQLARYSSSYIPQTGPNTNLVIGISVSGEVTRTYEALLLSKAAGATTLALTATPGSRIASAGDILFPSNTPPFPEPEGTHTPGVRSYIASQLALYLMSVRLGEVRGKLTSVEAAALRRELLGLADAVEKTIETAGQVSRSLVEEWADADEYVFVGGGPNFASALFSAAKVLEASGDRAMGQETEEWAHLQYFARINPTPTFMITAGQRDLSRIVEVAVAARIVGRRVAAIAPKSASALFETADRALPFAEGVREMFSPIVATVPGMLFAAQRSDLIGEPFFRGFLGGRSQEGGGGISRIRTGDFVETLYE